MALAHPPCSLFKSQRTSPPSPLSTTPAQAQKLEASAAVVLSHSVVVASVALLNEEVPEEASRDKTKAGVANNRINIMTIAVAEAVEVDDSAGEITTSHREIAMLRSISVPTGRCVKRSIFLD